MRLKAALYLRSTKDRADVSIDAQRRQLHELAMKQGLTVVYEYADSVESGKDEKRAGFLKLHDDLDNKNRGWSVLLVLDTSRLARRAYIAAIFEQRAEKAGVQVIFKSIPDTDPITANVMRGIFRAIDEYHSLISKQKALAGMAENIRQGYRAGGRAPMGYALETVHTGAMRDGEQVTKTRLKPSEDSGKVAAYLSARAAGISRAGALRRAGAAWPVTSALEMERNALVYAGCLVWNQASERVDGGYVGGQKQRPRSEWVIREDCHPALITRAEAEILLENLETRKHSLTRNRGAGYLLSGLLVSNDGRKFNGGVDKRTGRRYYCLSGKPGRYIPCNDIDPVITGKLIADLQQPEFIRQAVTAARDRAALANSGTRKQRQELQRTVTKLTGQIEKTMRLALDLEDSAPALRMADKLEAERRAIQREIDRLTADYATSDAVANITEKDIAAIIRTLSADLQNPDNDALKGLINKIIIDLETNAFQVHYTIKLASPKGIELSLVA